MALSRYSGLGRESVFGTAVAATKYLESVAKLGPDQGFIIPDPVCDPSRVKYNLGPYRVRGTMGPFDVTSDNIGEIINAIMGNGSYTKAGTSPYTHTWKCTTDLDPYTLRIGAEIEERILAGMLVDKLTLKATHGENLQATVEWVGPGAAETTGALASLTRANLTSKQPFVYHEGSGNLSIASSDKSANIYDWEVVIENHIPYERGNLYTRFMPLNRRGSRTVSGAFSLYFLDDDEYDRFITGASFALSLRLYKSANESIKLELPVVVYLRDAAHPVQVMDEPLVIDAPFQAFYDDGTYTEVKVTLINLENVSYT